MIYIGYEPAVGGIGDFIYILFQTFCWCQKHHVKMGICIPSHPLNNCISCIKGEPAAAEVARVITTTNVSCFLTDTISRWRRRRRLPNNIVIYSNMNDYLHIYLKYMNRSLLRVLLAEFHLYVLHYTDFIEEKINRLMTNKKNEYVAIHLRCGDRFLRTLVNQNDTRADITNTDVTAQIVRKIEIAAEFFGALYPEYPICFFCDSELIREQISKIFGFFYFPTRVVHAADLDNNDDDIYDSFCEFVLLGRAKAVFGLTRSNFSQVSALIHSVPFYTFMNDIIIQTDL